MSDFYRENNMKEMKRQLEEMRAAYASALAREVVAEQTIKGLEEKIFNLETQLKNEKQETHKLRGHNGAGRWL